MDSAILHDEMVAEGVRILVLRGPVCLCAYVGVPEEHPWAGKHCDAIDIDVHGGLTFSAYGKDAQTPFPDGWYWWGWDYAHPGDASPEWAQFNFHLSGRVWTLDDVIREAREGAELMIQYMRDNPIVGEWDG